MSIAAAENREQLNRQLKELNNQLTSQTLFQDLDILQRTKMQVDICRKWLEVYNRLRNRSAVT